MIARDEGSRDDDYGFRWGAKVRVVTRVERRVWTVVEFALGWREVGICARDAPEAVVKRDDGVGRSRTSG